MAFSVDSTISITESENNKLIYFNENNTSTPAGNEVIDQKKIAEKDEGKTIVFCKKCRVFRGRRAHHCYVCNRCSEKMDHHCHVIKNCVGEKNYKFFLSYLFSVTCSSLFILLVSLQSCRKFFNNIKVRLIYNI
jgi:hypothetical protein